MGIANLSCGFMKVKMCCKISPGRAVILMTLSWPAASLHASDIERTCAQFEMLSLLPVLRLAPGCQQSLRTREIDAFEGVLARPCSGQVGKF